MRDDQQDTRESGSIELSLAPPITFATRAQRVRRGVISIAVLTGAIIVGLYASHPTHYVQFAIVTGSVIAYLAVSHAVGVRLDAP